MSLGGHRKHKGSCLGAAFGQGSARRGKEALLNWCNVSQIPAILRAAIAAFLLAAAAGVAQAEAPAQGQTPAYSDAELLAALENSYWIRLSGPHPKKVYVIAAPWCPYCKQFHAMVSARTPDIEYRFVLVRPRSPSDRAKIGRAAFSHSPAALGEAFDRGADVGKAASPAEAFADGYNDALETALKTPLQAIAGRRLGVPAHVFVSAGRLRIVVGMPTDEAALASIEAEVDATAEFESNSPQLKALLATPPELKPIADKEVFARRDGTLLYAAPHTAAPKLAEIKAGARYVAKATTERDGVQWLAFQFTADGPPAAFGKAEDFQ